MCQAAPALGLSEPLRWSLTRSAGGSTKRWTDVKKFLTKNDDGKDEDKKEDKPTSWEEKAAAIEVKELAKPNHQNTTVCDMSLKVHTEGELSLKPVVSTSLDTGNLKTTGTLSGTLDGKFHAAVSAEAGCAKTFQWNFPPQPYTKTYCSKFGCVLFLLQGVAEVTLEGRLNGNISIDLDVSWGVSASVSIDEHGNLHGTADQSGDPVFTPRVEIHASAEVSLTLSLGPHLTAFFVPGAPVYFPPKPLEAQLKVKAAGALVYTPDTKIPTSTDACVSFAVNLKVSTALSGIGIDPIVRELLDTQFYKKALMDSITAIENKLLSMYDKVSSCIPGFLLTTLGNLRQAIKTTADIARAAVNDLVPDWKLELPPALVIFDENFFCKPVYQADLVGHCEKMNTFCDPHTLLNDVSFKPMKFNW